jgi:GAF domain-containing protein
MAGLLLRRRGVVTFGALSILAVLASVYAELQGVIVNQITTNTSTYITMITVGVTYGLTFTMMYILVNMLTNNLSRSRLDQEGLTAANEQLVAVRESLEQLVDVRTRAAEKARAEADAVRHEAEAQAWLARGQAQLAEKMRGGLDISALANNIIGHLGHYLDAQRGALFVSSGESLKLAGWHGYEVRAGQKNEFRLGEGLVGESARSKKIIRVGDIPADTSLGQSTPREILVIPLQSNDQVFGVIELATLNKFTPEHETFLNRVSESAAIALRSAQARMQMDQLLGSMRTGLKS